MTYVTAGGGPTGCVFCAALAARDDRRVLILHRSERAFLILNAFPYASGHLMAAVTRHGGGLAEASPAELTDAMTLVQRGMRALTTVYRPDGFNVGVNEGRVAGAGVPDHLHVHVVPRWNGDTNFMPVLGDVRVLPESLDATYERLTAVLAS
jgi:ATP adenylyltransferase